MINEKTVHNYELGIYSIVVLSIIYYTGFAVSTLFWEGKRESIVAENYQLKSHIKSLSHNISNLNDTISIVQSDLIQITGRHTSSLKYKRSLIYKEAGVRVSHNLSEKNLDLMMATADYYRIPYHIYFRVGSRESDNFSSTRSSPKGAMYYFQIMSGTFRNYSHRLGIRSHTIESNIRVSGLILSTLYKMYGGNWTKALAAYNAGEGAVDKYNGVPPYKETTTYVKFVMAFQKS